MSVLNPPVLGVPLRGLVAGFRRFTVDEYHKLLEMGMITEDDNLELLDGHLVKKMSRNPRHDGTLKKVDKRLQPMLPRGWESRVQMGTTLIGSEPEPDLLVAREDPAGYTTRHPEPKDVGLVIEVSDSSLETDRRDKAPIYAQSSLPEYWIINLVDRQIEVYGSPTGTTAMPTYNVQQVYRSGQSVPFALDGRHIADIVVDDLLP
jgi:Uma2 family endonuclease